MRPSQLPEVQAYPHLKRLLEIQIDMQFDDVHTMLQLPMPPDLAGGCNLALSNVLFALISGISVLFFRAELSYFKKYGQAGKRFKTVMREHYPWRPTDSQGPSQGVALIYTYARNPLTHSFGVGKTRHLFPGASRTSEASVMLAKRELSRTEADDVIAGQMPPPVWLPPTLRDEGNVIVLSVVALSWGTVAMLRSLFSDRQETQAAENLARQFLTGT